MFAVYSLIFFCLSCDLFALTLKAYSHQAKVREKAKKINEQGKQIEEQECIPVGCVPPTAVAVCWGDICLSACWDTPPWAWVWTPPWAWAWTPRAWTPPKCGHGHPPCVGLDTWPPSQPPQLPPWSGPKHPLVNRMTDRCKNITFTNFVWQQ